jgi:Flp pilus assembly secretin CpaC
MMGRDPTRSKIVINNKIIEQVNTFICLRNLISYEKEKNTDNKITIFLKITGINNIFKPNKVLKGTRIKLYNTPALSILPYGSENWTVKSKDKSRLTAA